MPRPDLFTEAAGRRQANRQLLPAARFTQVPNTGHFIALERRDVPANVLQSTAQSGD
jgi:hypothetical protein